MPELPEVETVRRTLERHLIGRTITRTRVYETRMRFPVDRELLENTLRSVAIRGLRRRAKYLLFDVGEEHVVSLHLGMSGRLRIGVGGESAVLHDHVVFALDDGRELRFNDPRRFGMVDVFGRSEESAHPRLCELGVEPLAGSFSAKAMRMLALGSKRSIKSFLMDANKVVGIGNIYASEALFLARVHPRRAAGRISPARWTNLVDATRTVLSDAIDQGGTTLRDFVDGDGTQGAYGERLRVYGRAGQRCPRECSGEIRRIVMQSRSTYYCPRCQR